MKTNLLEKQKQEREQTQSKIIYLLLHNKELLDKYFAENKLTLNHFDTDFHLLLTAIEISYKDGLLLSPETYEAYYSKEVPNIQGKIKEKVIFGDAYASICESGDYIHLQDKLIKEYEFKQGNKQIENYNYAFEKFQNGEMDQQELYNSLSYITEKYKPVDNSAYGKLYENLLPYRNFPIDIFPEEIKTALSFYIKKHNCAPDYIYNAFLCALSVAHGTKAVIKARGLNADARLWYMSLGSSSRGKSEPAKNIFQYFRELDDASKDDYDKEKEKYIKDKLIYEQKISTLKRKNKDITSDDLPKEKPVEPKRKEHIFADGTLEAMNRIIADNPEGTLLYIDDFFGWYSQLCKFNNSTAASGLSSLQRYSDNIYYETVKQGRAKEDNSLNIRKHYLCLYGNIQPEIIQRTLFHIDLRDSGFIHRLLFFFPDTTYIRAPKDVYEIPQKHSKYINSLFDIMREKNYCNCEWDTNHKTIPIDTQSEKVKEMYYQYWSILDYIEQNEKTYDSVLRSHIGRHKKHLSRLILNLHLLYCHIYKKDIDIIEEETIYNAVLLDRYYISHFLKLYNLFLKNGKQIETTNIKEPSLYDRVLTTIKNGKYSVRDISNNIKVSSEKIRPILLQLEKDGYGECIKSDKGRNKNEIAEFKLSA